MSRPRRSKRAAPSPYQVPRTARLNQVIREIVAEELERLDDERLEHVHITAVDVDSDLNRALVFYDSLAGEAGDADVLEAFGVRRVKLQAAVARQLHARKTPVLEFRPDEVLRSAERIDQILRELPPTVDQDGDVVDQVAVDPDIGDPDIGDPDVADDDVVVDLDGHEDGDDRPA